jgi:hypothetical protein
MVIFEEAGTKKTFSLVSSLAAIVCSVAAALGQAGAPTQRVHISGIPNGTSIYHSLTDRGSKFLSIGCIKKSQNGEFRISDWRGTEQPSVANAPPIAAREPLVLRLQGDQEMLNFHVGHEVQISGPILEAATASLPAKIKVESILYLSRVCWSRGTTTAESATSKP